MNGSALSPRTIRMFANTSWMPMVVKLIPHDRYEQMKAQAGDPSHAPQLRLTAESRQ